MAKKPLNIGIVGYGFMGRTHANGYHNAAKFFDTPLVPVLKAACEALQVEKLKGFGEKTQKAILEGICFAETAGVRLLWAEADSMVAQLRL